MNETIDSIVKIIVSGDCFIVASHMNPDGDAIGSTLALSLAMEALGKKVIPYNIDGMPFQYKSLPMADKLQSVFDADLTYDAVFVLDCSELERIGSDVAGSVRCKKWINIDHHLTNKTFADLTLIDKSACSTGYLVYKLILSLPVEISKDIATNIYTTILADTGSFRYSNATVEAFTVAGELVSMGVSPWEVAAMLYENQPRARINLLTKSLNTLEIESGGKVASMMVDLDMLRDTGTSHDATDGFINYARSIEGVEVAVFFRQINADEYKVSFRSKGRVNVAEVAMEFGGGGHKNAAGCLIKGDIGEVRKIALTAAKKSTTSQFGNNIFDDVPM